MSELKIGKSQIRSVDNNECQHPVLQHTIYAGHYGGRKQVKHTDDHSLLLLRPVHEYKIKHFQHNVVK